MVIALNNLIWRNYCQIVQLLWVKILLIKTFVTIRVVTMGVGGGRGPLDPPDFEIISKKRLFFEFRGVKKTNFTTFGSPLEKILKKSPTAPPWKKSYRRPWS